MNALKRNGVMVTYDYQLSFAYVIKVSMNLINQFAHGDNLIFGQLDGGALRPCPTDIIVLKNLTVNREHIFRLNVTTGDGERNSSTYSWFIGKHFFSICHIFLHFPCTKVLADVENVCLE
jgi:hypothetical protein